MGSEQREAIFVLNRETDGGVEVIDGAFDSTVVAISTVGSTNAYAVGIAHRLAFPPGADNIWHYGPDPNGGAMRWNPGSPPCPTNPLGIFFPADCIKFRAVWAESDARQWFAGDDGRSSAPIRVTRAASIRRVGCVSSK